ncbi:MAG: ABC transporter substrate-binding protein [Desulfohalobiaceae bacterium]|nr:ABC transporter substrate-binding protein [Desulfohalobiaceae bacterium]
MKDLIWKLGCIACIPVFLALLLIQPATAGKSKSKPKYTIGITQIVTHPALDANRKGFIDQLEKEGFVRGEDVKYDTRNAEGDMSLASSIAQKFVSQDVDLILSIATPTSQACVNEIQGEDIPLVFGSVTDPVAAGLVDSWDHPGDNVTGVSDWADVGAQVDLITDIVPQVKSLGVVYNAGETNSKVQVQELKKVAPEYGIENIEEASVDTSANVMTSAQSLMGSVDAVWVPTDNTVVSAFEAVVKVCEDNNIPLFAADTATVERGAIGTPGIDYYELGREDGKLAARILRGEDPGEIPVQRMEMNKLYLNPQAAERMGVTIPQSVLDRGTDIVEE